MSNYKFEVIEKIGAGAFGEVYKAKVDHARFAVKIVFTNSEDDVKEVMEEIRVHVGFNHTNIVKCDGFDFVSSRDNHIIEIQRAFPYRAWVIIMELCDSNLREQLRRRLSIDFQLTASYFRDILNGVNYFHSQKVIHRDLKPENILAKFINGNCIFKISDFGLGKSVDTLSPVKVSAIKGTPLYMAPEQGKGEDITMKVDVYSLGIILMELYTLEPIDQWINWTNRPMNVMELINTLNIYIRNNINNRKDVPREIHNLITRMTEIDPKDRPNCAEIVASLPHQ